MGASSHHASGTSSLARASPCPRTARTRDAEPSGRSPTSLYAVSGASILPGDDTKFTLDDLVNLIVRCPYRLGWPACLMTGWPRLPSFNILLMHIPLEC